MVFQVDDSWESKRGEKIFRLLLQRPGLRQYPIVEVPIESSVLHITILSSGNEPQTPKWSRYLCTSLAVTLDLVTQKNVSFSSIYAQINIPTSSPDLKLLQVRKIWEGIDEEGFSVLFYQCIDNEIFSDGLAELPRMNSDTLKPLWIDPNYRLDKTSAS
jgi:hypothetical protein